MGEPFCFHQHNGFGSNAAATSTIITMSKHLRAGSRCPLGPRALLILPMTGTETGGTGPFAPVFAAPAPGACFQRGTASASASDSQLYLGKSRQCASHNTFDTSHRIYPPTTSSNITLLLSGAQHYSATAEV
jgi:hypothetical protein